MFVRQLARPWALIVGALAALFILMLIAARTAAAAEKVPVRTAVQTTIGPADAPVRTADFRSEDRKNVQYQPVWWGRRWAYGPAPYATYYAPAPYAAYYAPAPYVAYDGPPVVYRYPRRVVYYGW